jgi:hypothetical protein
MQEEGTSRGEEKEEAAITAELEELKKNKGGKKWQQSSQFPGVYLHKRLNKWKVVHSSNGTQTHLGSYAKEEDVARAYIAFEKHGTRNVTGKRKPSSRFRGVHWNKAEEMWIASLSKSTTALSGRQLGRFLDEKDAARRYNDEVRRLGLPADRLNVIDEDGGNEGDQGNEGNEDE